MKTELNFGNVLLALFITTISLMGCSSLKTQKTESTELKSFKIVVEKTHNGIKMQSYDGSAWIDLSFNINKYQPMPINQYGMTDLNKITSTKDSQLADYLFTITKTEDGIELKGFKGTSWTSLSFMLIENGKQAIDQFGMTTLN